jgi:hypothetical protein
MPGNRSPAFPDLATLRQPKPERRQNVRFPMGLPVRYSLAKSCGWGRIVNIGSGGALFTIDQSVRQGQPIELCMGWPVLLNEKVHLNLVASGVIVRAEEGRAAARFEQCSFRTASSAFRRQADVPELRGGAESYG